MSEHRENPGGIVFWLFTATGVGSIAFGLINLLSIPRATHPGNWLRFFLEGLVLHDAILAPATCVAGFVLSRFVAGRIRAPIQVAALISGSVALVSIPVVSGYGRLANNRTILPSHHYGGHLAVIVGLVWAAALVWAAGRVISSRQVTQAIDPPA